MHAKQPLTRSLKEMQPTEKEHCWLTFWERVVVGAAAMLDISYRGDSTIDTATIKNDSAVVKDRIHRL